MKIDFVWPKWVTATLNMKILFRKIKTQNLFAEFLEKLRYLRNGGNTPTMTGTYTIYYLMPHSRHIARGFGQTS